MIICLCGRKLPAKSFEAMVPYPRRNRVFHIHSDIFFKGGRTDFDPLTSVLMSSRTRFSLDQMQFLIPDGKSGVS